MHPDQSYYKEMCYVLQKGLTACILFDADVIKWADDLIMSKDEIPDFLYDLSLSGSKKSRQSFSILKEESEGVTRNHVVFQRVLMGLLYERLKNGDISLTPALSAIYDPIYDDVLTSYEEDMSYIAISSTVLRGYKNVCFDKNVIPLCHTFRK